MKRTVLSLALCGALCLTGCSSLLEGRPYVMVEPHREQPVLSADSSALQVETYSELVNAVLFLVSQGDAEGAIQLVDYRGDVEEDLERACREVANDDPLGAYAVDGIQYSTTRVLTTYEADLSIKYRRTPEQIQGLVSVSSTSGIRTSAAVALREYRPELALRVSYFTGDANSVVDLVRQAYYSDPASAMGLPQYSVALYPNGGSGVQRVVEVVFTYSQPLTVMQRRQAQLRERVEELTASLPALSGGESVRQAQLFSLLTAARYDPEEELEVFLQVSDQNGTVVRAEAQERGGGVYTGTLALPQGSSGTLAVGFRKDGVEYLQPLVRIFSVAENGLSWAALES